VLLEIARLAASIMIERTSLTGPHARRALRCGGACAAAPSSVIGSSLFAKSLVNRRLPDSMDPFGLYTNKQLEGCKRVIGRLSNGSVGGQRFDFPPNPAFGATRLRTRLGG